MKTHPVLNLRRVLLSMLCVTTVAACKKGAGEGGSSTVKGKVTAHYTDVFNNVYSYPAQKEDVYIVYGDEDFYGDNVETSYDGTYEFRYLKKGSYKIFAYSDCDTCLGGNRVELVNVEITKNKSDVTADLNIVKD